MSTYPNINNQDLFNFGKLAEQQKNQRAIEIKNEILKQTHDKKLAQSFAAIIKKLEDVDKSTKIWEKDINKISNSYLLYKISESNN